MNKIIIYGSCYGTAKMYAEELSKRTLIKAVDFEDVKNPREIAECETIVYVGALYAGGVLGMAKTFKRLEAVGGCGWWKSKKIIIATVGLADPLDAENICNIKKGMKRQLSDEIFEKAEIFHLRGGIDYSKLKIAHKTMMGLLYHKAKNLPEAEKDAETRPMIETYNSVVNFVDFNALSPIADVILG